MMMVHIEITVPVHDNDGHDVGYVPAMRAHMLTLGFEGWTEHACLLGSWHGIHEPVVVFVVYVDVDRGNRAVAQLGEAGRAVMLDQDAIMVTSHGVVEVRMF